MNPQVREILLAADVAGAWEHPPDANWQSSIDSVRGLKPALEEILGLQLHLDDSVQDASFYADLGELVEQNDQNGVVYLTYNFCIRFSWFSRLVTVCGQKASSFNVAGAVALLEREGYKFVPAAELSAPYDGINPPYEQGLTWWTRYFDYL